jgi:hypothetical protein
LTFQVEIRTGSTLAPARDIRGYAPRVRGGVVALALVAALTIGATPASARVYRGVMTNGAGAVRSGEQGALLKSLPTWTSTCVPSALRMRAS